MSISLKAYPLGFLIYPNNAKPIQLGQKSCAENNNAAAIQSQSSLEYIKVKTNLSYKELKRLLTIVPGMQLGLNDYLYDNELRVKWDIEDGCSAIVSGGKDFQNIGETFFEKLDAIAGRNIRLTEDSKEHFYYNYITEFCSIRQIMDSLKQNQIKNFYYDQDENLCVNIKGETLKYYKPNNSKYYHLETEQTVSIVNIGMDNEQNCNRDSISEKIKEIRVKTNIKKEELKFMLQKAKYRYFEGNGQTLLGSGATTLNWIEEDGYCYAMFTGSNERAMISDMSKLFEKLNIASGRDVRKIDEKTNIIYTYSTNYTDKGVLYNVLLEHGAQEVTEDGDNITCKLYDMDMNYIKDMESGVYNLEISRITDLEHCESTISDLNEEYGLSIQEITYNKIKERLEQENLRLYSEEVLDDNSIVLTIEV